MNLNFILDVSAAVFSVLCVIFVFQTMKNVKGVSLEYLFYAVLYGMVLRMLLLLSYVGVNVSVESIASLMSFYWLLLTLGFYSMFLTAKEYRRLHG